MTDLLASRALRLALVAAALLAAIALLVLLLRPSSGSAQPALSWSVLRNATYPSEFPRAKQAPLQEGVYEEEAAPGSATRLKVQLADIAGFGRLDANSSTDAAVVLISSPGGSGTFIHLVAVLNQDGEPVPVATTLLGDRVAVRAVRIEENRIIVGMRVRGPTDPFAVLTTEVTRSYSLQGDQLTLEGEEARDVPSAPPDEFSFEPKRLTVEVGKAAAAQGVLKPGELVTYLVAGSAGQELSVSARSQFNNAILSIQGVTDTAQLISRSAYATSWSGRLSVSQDYAVTVVTLAGNDLTYSLSIELKAAPPPTATPRAATATPPAPATATPRPAPTATPRAAATRGPGDGAVSASIPAPITGPFRPEARPLATLSAAASRFLEARAPAWGAAVASATEGVLYSQNGDALLELASVVKVLVALAVLDAAQDEQRYVDRFELSLLWPMITLSDNDSTTELWDQIGGGRGLSGYLASIGATGIRPYDGPFWGTSMASANALATVLARAAFGDLLNREHRALFLNLLQKVTPDQRWGVSAGAEGDGLGGIVGIKDGWYPAEAGWRVNSTGFVVSTNAQRLYTLAVLTNGQPSWDYGIETIEGTAGPINRLLLGSTGLPRLP